MSVYAPQEPTLHSDAMVRWLVPERVLYMWAAGDVSPSVHDWMNARAIFYYHSCRTPKIHLVIDMRSVTAHSGGTNKDRPAVSHPRRGWMVSIGGFHNRLVHHLINFWARLLRLNFIDCHSIEAALENLQKIDPTLPDLTPYWHELSREKQSRASGPATHKVAASDVKDPSGE